MININKINFLILYRMLFIFYVIYIHYDAHNSVGKDIDFNSLIFYCLLILYLLAFSLIKHPKISYVELFAIFALNYYYEHNILFCLLILPILELVSKRIKMLDNLLYTMLFTAFFYLKGYPNEYIILISIFVFLLIEVLNSNFKQMENLEENLFEARKLINVNRNLIGEREREIEITSNMFLHSKYLSETIEVEELMQLMVDSSKTFFNADYCCLYTKREDGFYIEKESGEKKKHVVPEMIANAESNEIKIDSKMIRMTIDFEESPWGIIAVYGKKSKIGDTNQIVSFPFTDDDFEVLSVYMKMAMSPIKHANLLKTMNYLANNDFLTGLSNRRSFIEQFNYLKKIASRGQNLALLIMDIDHFKSVNDTYGHQAGDDVLKEVAETIKYTVREVDVVGRLGGEEFGVLLLGSDGNELMIAERIRTRVEKINFHKKLSISIGVAYFNKDAKNWEELFKKSDAALYHAKENGRNQVVIYQEGMVKEN